ncbi:MAG: response regulator [Chlorobi bacterium]|nr:response regulator [Chlorobiota bacterium]
MKILIAEDNDLNYMILERLLQAVIDASVIRAENGKEAVEYCKTHPEIALVLMDIKMPVMDGYEATRQIRKLYPELPVIAQTAHAMTENKETAFRAGCNDYLTKPILKDTLRQMIEKYLTNKTH